jgi:alcohol dehydrogenase class IV
VLRAGAGALADAPALLAERGFDRFTLLCTARSQRLAEPLLARAAAVVHVPQGGVPDAAAAIVDRLPGVPVVAFGGGRVIDVAKAVGSARGLPVAAIPTTLSGAEMTGHHRPIPGQESVPRRRPALVITDGDLLMSLSGPALAATAMNALAHAAEALVTPAANPLAEAASLQAARQIAHGLGDDVDVHALALGGLLAGYAAGLAGFAVHHVVCQTLVRIAGAPHAMTNAVMLPHTVGLLSPRSPREMTLLGRALAADVDARGAIARLAALAGPVRLRDLGVDHSMLDAVVATAMGRADLSATPDPPGREELRGLLESAY